MKTSRTLSLLAATSLGLLTSLNAACTNSRQTSSYAAQPQAVQPQIQPRPVMAPGGTVGPNVSPPSPQQPAGSVVALSSANFDAIVNRPGAVVLVDFAADWCGPCRQLAPTIDRVAAQFGGQAVVARVDVDTDEQIALRYGVEALPTLVYFKNGKAQRTSVGPASEQAIATELRQLLQ